MAKKILIITPRFPLPAAGACEQERLSGIKQLRRLGFDVRVIAKIFDFQDRADIDRFSRDHGIPVDLMPYDSSVRQGLAGALLFYLRRIMNPFHWDGAAYEYAHRETRRVVERITDTWKPDIAWFDYTYLWPLYPIFRQRKIPIVTRSINFEPTHFLQEDGCTPINIVKFFQKLLSEWIVRYKSAIIFAITPREAAAYQRLGARTVKNLPLRSLSVCLTGAEHPVRTGGSLNIFFAGSTYTVFHNRQTLDFILREIIPVLEQRKPGKFVFHFTGKKLPNDLRSCLSDRVIYHGFVEDFEDYLASMDIALVPSLFGAGMQQKIFEPLARGIPTVTSPRGLAGYPFNGGEHVLLAESADEFVHQLLRLQDVELRRTLSRNSRALARTLFSADAMDAIVLEALHSYL